MALAAKVDLTVAGDDDLLALGRFEDISIIAPAEAVKRIG